MNFLSKKSLDKPRGRLEITWTLPNTRSYNYYLILKESTINTETIINNIKIYCRLRNLDHKYNNKLLQGTVENRKINKKVNNLMGSCLRTHCG